MILETDVSGAYRKGLELRPMSDGDPDGSCFRKFEAKEAARNWRRALDEHEHTSFYGVPHIRAMRAYWLGLARSAQR